MHIVGVEGPYGSGKTTTAVLKAHQWAAASGAKIFANFPLRGAYLFDTYEDWYRIADAHGSILIFDESEQNWDGRKWASQGQIDQTHVINYVRKMNSLFIFILPDYNDIESRVRKKTDILIECKKTTGGILNLIYDPRQKEFGDKGKLVNRWFLPKEAQKKIWDLKLFNTHSMVQKFPTPPPNKVDHFFKELDRRHSRALERVYGKQYLEIQTLAKDEFDNVVYL